MTGEIVAPQRALTLTFRVGADTKRDLVTSLLHFAQQIERDELGTGTFGGPGAGGSYELVTIDKPHEEYFRELHAYLDARRAAQEAASGERSRD